MSEVLITLLGGAVWAMVFILVLMFIPLGVQLVQTAKNPVHFHGVPSHETACFKKHKKAKA